LVLELSQRAGLQVAVSFGIDESAGQRPGSGEGLAGAFGPAHEQYLQRLSRRGEDRHVHGRQRAGKCQGARHVTRSAADDCRVTQIVVLCHLVSGEGPLRRRRTMFGLRFLKSQPTTYLMAFRNGKIVKQGAGASIVYFAPTTTLVAVPVGSRNDPFIFE